MVLTGAGISAESGIPTFRGPEGYWTIGSREYMPQEIGRLSMFQRYPRGVWSWYLYRLGVCRNAQPNLGHKAVVDLEQLFPDRFSLVTQNVDGLHLRAGNQADNTFQIHGNLDYMRCLDECTDDKYPIPAGLELSSKEELLPEEKWAKLSCPKCGALSRPHLLWWDESYNEEHYRASSALSAAAKTGLLIVVGTSGSTNLPHQVVQSVLSRRGLIIDVNIEESVFTRAALDSGGEFLNQASGEALPTIFEGLRDLLGK